MDKSTAVAAVFVLLLAPFIWAFPIQMCWNFGLAPAVEGVNQIGFWQAFLIGLLANMLTSTSAVAKKD